MANVTCQYNGAPLQIIYRLDIARKVPIDGLISIADLALACGDLYESDLRAIIRYAIVFHRCFCEPVRNLIGHSAASRRLAENQVVRDGVGWMFDSHQLAFTRIHTAIEAGKSRPKEPGNAPWALAYASPPEGLFGDLENNPELAIRFQGAMKHFMSVLPGANPQLLIDYDLWSTISPHSTVVDVGGGDGWTARLLAKRYPHFKVILQDKPHVVKMAQDMGTVEIQAHDFFEDQSLRDVDVFILRWILHDWPDSYAVRILKALIPALKNASRVLINDQVSPGQSGTIPFLAERAVRRMDLVMLSNCNSYEREIEDWERIVKQADSRFHLVRVTPFLKTSTAVVELKWDSAQEPDDSSKGNPMRS